jgi:hypothetical protein
MMIPGPPNSRIVNIPTVYHSARAQARRENQSREADSLTAGAAAGHETRGRNAVHLFFSHALYRELFLECVLNSPPIIRLTTPFFYTGKAY